MSLKNYSRYGVTYFQLYISCPVCNNEGRNTPHSYWSHDVDGGDVYVGDDATYQCKQCGHTRHVSDWEYGCPRHSGGSDEYVYKKSTIASIASVISCAGQMVSETGLTWLRVFMENLEIGWDNLATKSRVANGDVEQKKEAETLFSKGKELMNSPDCYKEAADCFLKSAKMGHAKAQNWLGHCYQYGFGVKKDWVESFRWRMKAALQGVSQAQCFVGVAYLQVDSDVVTHDEKIGFNWIKKSAEGGYANGIAYLGYCYYHGMGVTKDAKKAYDLIRQAVQKGSILGKQFLASFFGESI